MSFSFLLFANEGERWSLRGARSLVGQTIKIEGKEAVVRSAEIEFNGEAVRVTVASDELPEVLTEGTLRGVSLG